MILKGISVNQDPPTKDYLWITPKGNTRFWNQSTWMLIGGSSGGGGGDLSNYYTKSQTDDRFYNKSWIDTALASYIAKDAISGVSGYAAVFTNDGGNISHSIHDARGNDARIRIGDGIIEWDSTNNGFKIYNATSTQETPATAGIYADWVSALGANSSGGGGGGGGMDETALWQELTDDPQWTLGDDKIININHLPNNINADTVDGYHANSFAFANGINATGTWGISISGNAATATKATQDGSGNTISSTYLPLAGGNMIGNIGYTGSKVTNTMITFINNTSDAYGNGIAIGGGGQTIIGGGESAATVTAQVGNAGAELMYVCNDEDVNIISNLQSGWSYRKILTWYNGYLGLLGDVTSSDAAGIYWHTRPSSAGTNGNYGIYKTAGSWSGNYQQLKLDWPTGIILDGGSSYGKSGVQVAGLLYINDYIRIGQGGNVIDGYRLSNNTFTNLHLNYYSNGNTTLNYGGGNVGIGTTSPNYKLDVSGDAFIGNTFSTSHTLSLQSSACQLRMFAYSDGNCYIEAGNSAFNGNSTSGILYLAGYGNNVLNNIELKATITHCSNNFYATGGVTALSSVSSDKRLKKNIKQFEAKSIIDKLKPVEFEWNKKANKYNSNLKLNKKNYGLIAQDSDGIIDNLVFDLPDGKGYKGVRYEKLIPILLQAVKEQQKEIDELKQIIKKLKV